MLLPKRETELIDLLRESDFQVLQEKSLRASFKSLALLRALRVLFFSIEREQLLITCNLYMNLHDY